MAPRSDGAGGDPGAVQPSAIAATAPTTQTSAVSQSHGLTPPKSQPLPLVAGLRGVPRHLGPAARRAGDLNARPGALLQEQLLYSYYDTAIPGSISVSPPAFIWLTPPSKSPRFNLSFIRNAVRFLLVAHPGRLQVRRACQFVFRVRVSCQNIASVLVLLGSLRLGSSVLSLHASMAVARARSAYLPQGEDAFTAQQPAYPPSPAVNGPAVRSADTRLRGAPHNLNFTAPGTALSGDGLLPTPGANAGLIANHRATAHSCHQTATRRPLLTLMTQPTACRPHLPPLMPPSQ